MHNAEPQYLNSYFFITKSLCFAEGTLRIFTEL